MLASKYTTPCRLTKFIMSHGAILTVKVLDTSSPRRSGDWCKVEMEYSTKKKRLCQGMMSCQMKFG